MRTVGSRWLGLVFALKDPELESSPYQDGRGPYEQMAGYFSVGASPFGRLRKLSMRSVWLGQAR